MRWCNVPIDVQCLKCGRKLRVADQHAGKRAKCPKCQAILTIPAAAAPSGGKNPAPTKAAPKRATPLEEPAAKQPGQWYLQTDDGQQYGPASKDELDAWAAEGRIDATCQVLCDGWEQWKWAEEVYPSLATPAAQPVQPAAEDNPLAALFGEAAPAAAAAGAEINPFDSPAETASVPAPDATQPGQRGAITPGAQRALQETRPWVTFLAVLGFIFGGLGTFVGVILLGAMTLSAGFGGMLTGLFALIGPAVWVGLSYYLFTYGQRIHAYLRSERPRDLEAALVAQKSFWKLTGIIIAIVVGLYLVMILLMILFTAAGVMAGSARMSRM